MTAITLHWEDEGWPFDEDEITMQQAFVIKDQTKDEQFPGGRGIHAWQLGLKNGDPACVRAAYWLMRQQAGERFAIQKVPDDFPLGAWYEAWKLAGLAGISDPELLRKAVEEGEKHMDMLRRALAAAEAAAEPEDDGEDPTSRPGRRSRTPGSPKAASRDAASSPSGEPQS